MGFSQTQKNIYLFEFQFNNLLNLLLQNIGFDSSQMNKLYDVKQTKNLFLWVPS